MRRYFALFRFWVIELCALCLREEIHGLQTIPEVHVGRDANNLVHSRVFLWDRTEVLPDGILLAEEPLRKCVVDHSHRPRIGIVLVADGPSRHDLVPEGFEKSRCYASPTR